MVKKAKKPINQLTDVELEMMNIIWKFGPCTVNQILEKLPSQRNLAYTSVSTMVRILEQKGFVKSAKEGRGHLYRPAIEKDVYEATTIDHVISKVFDGQPAALVKRLLAHDVLSEEALRELKKLIDAEAGK